MGPADYVWALVSGLPKRERERRLIMVLQAFVDDSGSDPQSLAFILGGFVASPIQWVAFSDEWDRTLRLPPKLNYFKNNEAMGLKGQFDKTRGWTEQKRDDRLVALAGTITKYIPERFSVAVRHTDYDKYISGIPVLKRVKTLENPYFLLFHEFMLITASVHSVNQTMPIPCKFVFDNQGKIGEQARNWWPDFRTHLQNASNFDFSPYFDVSKPSFENDKQFMPLQAADLYAGQLGRAMASDKIVIPPSPALRNMWRISGYHRVIDYKYLAPMRARFMEMATRIEAANPGTLKYIMRTGKKRNKRKQRP